jgi:hypothetical protein
VAEDERLTRTPVFVVDLCAVFGGDRAHFLFLLRLLIVPRAVMRLYTSNYGGRWKSENGVERTLRALTK